MHLRVSASDLVSFWYTATRLRTYDYTYEAAMAIEEALVMGLLDGEAETEAMRRGTLIHELVEGDKSSELLAPEELETIRKYCVGNSELPTCKTYETMHGAITVSQRIDYMHGNEIIDLKTRVVGQEPTEYDKQRIWDKYSESPQALFYADAMSAERVTYVVVWLGNLGYMYKLLEIQEIVCDTSAREQIHQSCLAVLDEFMRWASKYPALIEHYQSRFVKNPEQEIA